MVGDELGNLGVQGAQFIDHFLVRRAEILDCAPPFVVGEVVSKFQQLDALLAFGLPDIELRVP